MEKKYECLMGWAHQQHTFMKGDIIFLEEADMGRKALRKNYVKEYAEPKLNFKFDKKKEDKKEDSK
jgi:hypothetical protein